MKTTKHKLALASVAIATIGLAGANASHAQVSQPKHPFHKQARSQKPSVESYSMVVQSRGRLGAKVITMSPDLRKFFGAPSDQGLLVDQVVANTPAAKAGLQSGDVIVKVGGKAISEHWDILQATGSYKKGETLEIEVIRGKKTRKLNAVLDTDESIAQLNHGPGNFNFDFNGSPFDEDFGKDFFDHGSMNPGSILEKMRRMEERLNKLEGTPSKKASDKDTKSTPVVPFRPGSSGGTSTKLP